MKTKNLIILGVVLLGIVGIIILTEGTGSKKKSDKTKEFFPKLAKSSVFAFSITENNQKIKIKRKGDGWIIATGDKDEGTKADAGSILDARIAAGAGLKDYPADSASVESVLEKLAMMKKDELISQNPDKQAVFEVDSAKGMLVEFWDNQNKLVGSFRIGKNGPDWNSHYVRTVGSNDVYNVLGSIKYAFFADEKRWRDKSVIQFNAANAKTISIAKKDSGVTELAKSVDTAGVARWDITAPKACPADSLTVSRILTTLSNFTTADWEDTVRSDSALGFNDPYLVVAIGLDNGDKKVLTIGGEKGKDNQRWLKADDKEAVFVMYKSRFDDFNKTFDQIKKIDPAQKEEPKKAGKK